MVFGDKKSHSQNSAKCQASAYLYKDDKLSQKIKETFSEILEFDKMF